MIFCSILIPIAQILLIPFVIGIQFIGLTDLSLTLQESINSFFSNTLGCLS